MNKTGIQISEEMREKCAGILNQQLADLSDLISQTRYAHWNVRGSMFHPLHKLFEEIYASLDAIVDEVAERITTLGAEAKGTIRMAVAASSLPEFKKQKDAIGFVRELKERMAKYANATRENVDATAQLGDMATSDLLTELLRIVDKDLWLLEAHDA
jgi:starvation-inducible DNA-binding protein